LDGHHTERAIGGQHFVFELLINDARIPVRTIKPNLEEEPALPFGGGYASSSPLSNRIFWISLM